MTLHYVQIRDGVVVNRAVAHEPLPPDWFPEGETWIETEEAQIGWSHDGKDFTPPPPPEPEPPAAVIISYGAFRALWTDDELAALFAAKKNDWRVEDYCALAAAQNAVNLSGETAAEAKALFVAIGVLSEERADVIFGAT